MMFTQKMIRSSGNWFGKYRFFMNFLITYKNQYGEKLVLSAPTTRLIYFRIFI